MEISANRHRRLAPDLVPGQKVWLLRRNVTTTRPSSKLDVRRLGPYAVVGQVGSSAYRLDLPRGMSIHPVFHVSLLEPHVANTFPGRVEPTPMPIEIDGLPVFEVRAILDSRFRRGKLQYLVDWVGYDQSERSWQPAVNIEGATEAVAEYHQDFPDRPRPRS